MTMVRHDATPGPDDRRTPPVPPEIDRANGTSPHLGTAPRGVHPGDEHDVDGRGVGDGFPPSSPRAVEPEMLDERDEPDD